MAIVLEWEGDDPIFDFELIGFSIATPLEYEVAFILNQEFDFHLKRIQDLEIFLKTGKFNYSVFDGFDKKTQQSIKLIANFSQNILQKSNPYELFDNIEVSLPLIPEFKRHNFLIKSKFLFDEEFYVNLQKITKISQFEKINIKKIKNFEYLILPI